MSILSRTVALSLVALSIVAVGGCTSTGGSRFASLGAEPPSKAKTYLAVGDKPLPVVTGEPGDSVAADTEPAAGPSRAAGSEAKISGRVYGADGAPVPNAHVRLAVSGALGGKVVTASTDRSGAFTLRGLRPGSTYTVIAEHTGNDGKLAGRASARSSDSEVRITLGADGTETAEAVSPIRGVSNHKASEAERSGEEEIFPGSPRDESDRPKPPTRVNEEDLPPPAEAAAAPEAAAMAPAATEKSRAGTSNRSSAPTWRRGGQDEGHSTPKPPADPEPEATHSAIDQSSNAASALPDEGPNPLPPAARVSGEKPRSEHITDPSGEREAHAPNAGTRGDPESTTSQADPARLASLAKTPKTRPAPAASSSFEDAAARKPPRRPSTRPARGRSFPKRTLRSCSIPSSLPRDPALRSSVTSLRAASIRPPLSPKPESLSPSRIPPRRSASRHGARSRRRVKKRSHVPACAQAGCAKRSPANPRPPRRPTAERSSATMTTGTVA